MYQGKFQENVTPAEPAAPRQSTPAPNPQRRRPPQHRRKRTTTGVYKFFSEDIYDRDGLECHSMLINIGEKNDPEDDRLFYYDAYKPAPAFEMGEKITVISNDKMVSSIHAA